MAMDKLSALRVVKLKNPGYHGDGGGLYLRIGPTGTKSWVFRYKVTAGGLTRTREMGLGAFHTFGLAEARERARDCRKQRYDGIDPIEVRRERRQAAKLDAAKTMTFSACAETYIAAHRAGWKNEKHAAQWPATIKTYAEPVFGKLSVAAVDTTLVMKVLEPIWREKPETASRLRGRIESVLDWATVRGYRRGENPARWKGHLDTLLPAKAKVRAVVHHAALPYAELPKFMAELRQRDGIAARTLEFAILTCARTGEVIGAHWDEIDLAGRLWEIPAERMKAGKPHRAALSDAVLAILEVMAVIRSSAPCSGQGQAFVFPGQRPGKPLSNMAMLMLLRDMDRGNLTVHGFRSCFRVWAAECTRYPAEIAELALAHDVGSAVTRAYLRSDRFERRRALAEDWAAYCGATDRAAGAEVVVALRG